MPGGVTLLGGQPGIGKSTLLLQVCGNVASKGGKVLYISGEESPSQLGLRAKRLNVLHDGLDVCCHTVIDDALGLVKDHQLVIVDSVQAMRTTQAEGWPGTPTQVRAVAQVCVNHAKENGVPMVLVGHITKEGRIAGPMLLEHMVLSHHDLPEYGSPKPPMFPEAEVLHILDLMDARIFEMNRALKAAQPGGFTERIWSLERKLYRRKGAPAPAEAERDE